MSTAPLAHRVATLSPRVLLVVVAWWVLVEGEASALVFGAPVIALAILARYAVAAEAAGPRIRPRGLARFARVFVGGMIRGSFDVAWRALSPRLPVSPGWLLYDVTLAGDTPRRLLMALISVMPGTLCVDVEGDKLRLHLLVASDDGQRRQVEALEGSIALLVGESEEREA